MRSMRQIHIAAPQRGVQASGRGVVRTNAPSITVREEEAINPVDGLVTEAMRSSGGVAAWAIRALFDQGMPWAEIGSILGSDDPALVRRTLELHRERLEEHLAEQRAELDRIQPLILEALDIEEAG